MEGKWEEESVQSRPQRNGMEIAVCMHTIRIIKT